MFCTDRIMLNSAWSSPYKFFFEEIYDKSCETFENIILTWSSLILSFMVRGVSGCPVWVLRGGCFQNSICTRIRNTDWWRNTSNNLADFGFITIGFNATLDWPLYFQTLFIALPITGSPPQIFPWRTISQCTVRMPFVVMFEGLRKVLCRC